MTTEGGDEQDDLTTSLLNVPVVPLSRTRAGRDFNFEVVAARPSGGRPPLVSSTTSGESLTLAALSAQESAQWIKAI